ncbi:MAG TPA: PAS domain-containing sensor histidine kinase [Cyanobacteria bacterium UBA11149]|nr:PAS domain-containing sensor histidine kinase [Cyanobacteria bacterium UBA11367]HBE56536.1 PAS domain-containing sensor histidine kinase [Cyanobacteria bacterium UBA11366]HBK62370.1 PAS domain-containing sensor histidine kinase [Cyanobacteria bacterium UBA11166]HBR75675.1 PAS domain-containing sensor histidine kinase [Cyanobacteria bacterium UBA11159]HBS68605.1 PAS domain-containing sensor histidine kinase [Cyanobacteria bacterium UBA11153]HBW91138.1 PAS domain-containing sensor histidine k
MKAPLKSTVNCIYLKVLLLEDSSTEAKLIQDLLSKTNTIQVELTRVRLVSQAIEELHKKTFDVILLDLSLPDSQGLDTISRFKEYGLNTPIVVLTACNDQELALQAIQSGAQDYLVKGNVSSEILIRSLRYAAQRQISLEALRLSEEKYRSVVNNIKEVIFQTDIHGNWTFLNPAWKEITGFSVASTLGTPISHYIYPDDLPRNLVVFRTLIEGKKDDCRYQIRYLTNSGRFRWLEVHSRLTFTQDGKISGTTGTLNDITEQKLAQEALRQSEEREREKAKELEMAMYELKRAQSQLVQNEKMVSLGQLVAGVAHEINNPIGFIYSNITPATQYAADLLRLIDLYQQQYPNPPRDIQEELEAIDFNFLKEDFPQLLVSMREGANRIQEIVISLRNFSHLDKAEKKTVDLHAGIDSTLMILKHRLKKQYNRPAIQVVKEYGQLPAVKCYPGQLNQVFMNILTNAIDALAKRLEDDPYLIPSIGIRTQLSDCQTAVLIGISDNGYGVPPAVKPHLFDPFFTTKPVGSGSGLGLSISHSIVVEKHQGELECHSHPGRGTEFVIKLPLYP